MLAGELSYLDGARIILELRWTAEIPEDDQDIAAYVLIESETDHLPIGGQRQYWSLEALNQKESDLRRAEDWARRTAGDETRRMLHRLGDHLKVRTLESEPSSSRRLAKLSFLDGSDWHPNRYERVWWQEKTTGAPRIVAAVSDQQVETALRLAACVASPYLLLWVLHTPRGGSRPGRYQSPPLSFEQLRETLVSYRQLFEQDGRSDIWIYAQEADVTVVLDRHDLIYTYAPIQTVSSALSHFRNGQTTIPSPHSHHYHAELDELERNFAHQFEWHVTALRPEDEP
jgi:hypothetical protein